MSHNKESKAVKGPVNMSTELVSICGRADNGKSRPFFCEAEDGHFYFVKRDNVTRDELVMDYLMSRLAEECGLPVAPVKLVHIPKPLAAHAMIEHGEEFQSGIAFGSQRVPFADEIRSAHLRSIDEETKIRCLCFDWWVRNPDRRLDMAGGDPNVLWDPVLHQIFLIDHDQCLAADFDPVVFKREHVFRDVRPFIDKAFFKKWRTRFESAIYHLDKIWAEMPAEWTKGPARKSLLSFTRQNLESRLIKPALPADAILM